MVPTPISTVLVGNLTAASAVSHDIALVDACVQVVRPRLNNVTRGSIGPLTRLRFVPDSFWLVLANQRAASARRYRHYCSGSCCAHQAACVTEPRNASISSIIPGTTFILVVLVLLVLYVL